MDFGCCIGIEHYDAVVSAGYRNITLPCTFVAMASEEDFSATMDKVHRGPLVLRGLNAFSPPELKMTGLDFDVSKIRAYVEKLVGRAAQLGVKTIGVGCPKSRNVPEGFAYRTALAQFSECLAITCQTAAKAGIDVLVESVCTVEGNFLTTMAEALFLVKSLGFANLFLVYDIYHSHMMGEDPSVVCSQCGDYIRTVHFAQDVEGQRHYLHIDKIKEYRPYMQALKSIGYTGEVSMEAFYGDLAAELPRSLSILQDLEA